MEPIDHYNESIDFEYFFMGTPLYGEFDRIHDLVVKGIFTPEFDSEVHCLNEVAIEYYRNLVRKYVYLRDSSLRLNHIPMYILEKSIPPFFAKTGINPTWYYQYHFENHYILLSSIIDYCYNFAIEVFQFTHENMKDSTKRNDFRNSKKDEYCEVQSILLRMRNSFTKITDERNTIIHQGYLRHKDLDMINQHVYKFYIEELGGSTNPKDRTEFEKGLDEIAKKMRDEVLEMVFLMNEFFTALVNPFREKFDELNKPE